MCACMRMWGPGFDVRCLPQDRSLDTELAGMQSGLASKAQELTCSHLLRTRIADVCHLFGLFKKKHGFWGPSTGPMLV